MQKILFTVCVLIVFASCEKPPSQEKITLPTVQEGGIFILNEGSFNNGNATLSFVDFKQNTLTDDVFYTANNRHLGDVLQSITVRNGTAYLVINNSKKIELIDVNTFQSKGTIAGFNSPRYITFLNDQKAYVSDLYDNNIAVVDLGSKTITQKIYCPGATEQMLIFNNKLYVCNTLQKSVYIIDVNTDKMIDSISVSYGSNSIVLDKNNKIWVLCSGNQQKNLNAGLYRINPANDSIELAIKTILPTGIFGATKLCMNGNKDRLFWLNTDVNEMNISDTTLSSNPFISASKNNFYGLGIDPINGDVYVSDALDYVQKSTIFHYRFDASYVGFFKGGIITSGFYFYYK